MRSIELLNRRTMNDNVQSVDHSPEQSTSTSSFDDVDTNKVDHSSEQSTPTSSSDDVDTNNSDLRLFTMIDDVLRQCPDTTTFEVVYERFSQVGDSQQTMTATKSQLLVEFGAQLQVDTEKVTASANNGHQRLSSEIEQTTSLVDSVDDMQLCLMIDEVLRQCSDMATFEVVFDRLSQVGYSQQAMIDAKAQLILEFSCKQHIDIEQDEKTTEFAYDDCHQHIDDGRNFLLVLKSSELLNDFQSITSFDELFSLLNDNDDDVEKSFQLVKQLMEDRIIDEKRNVLRCIANEILERFPAMNAEHVIDRLISCDGDVDKEIRNIVSEFNQLSVISSITDVNEDDKYDMACASVSDRRRQQALLQGALVTCPICTDDDILPELMVCCNRDSSPHYYCIACTKHHAELSIANGEHSVRCLSDECDDQLSMTTIRRLVDKHLIDQLDERIQQSEVRAANLTNFELCKFCCTYGVIFDAPITVAQIFKCQNSSCMKIYCRQCGEMDHRPKACKQIERDIETKRRIYIENCIANAMIRKCPTCQKPIVMTHGCNKMQCPCGTKFCYICNVQINDYSHFRQQGCEQQTNVDQLHRRIAKEAGEQAKRLFIQENPDANVRGDIDVNSYID